MRIPQPVRLVGRGTRHLLGEPGGQTRCRRPAPSRAPRVLALEAPTCLRCLHWVATQGCCLCLQPVQAPVPVAERMGSWPLRACAGCAGEVAAILLAACQQAQAALMERLRADGY